MPFLIDTALRRWLPTAVAVPLPAPGARNLARRRSLFRGRR